MKKIWIIGLIICLCAGIIIGFEVYQYQGYTILSRINKTFRSEAKQGKQGHQQIQKTNSEPDKVSQKQPGLPEALPILGESKELTAVQKADMDEWRKDVQAMAGQYPDVVFINGGCDKKVCLTFDDGPDAVNTPKILDILKEHHVKGNFFFKGNRVNENPEVVKRAAREGNLVLSHTYNHLELNKHSLSEIDNEIELTENAISGLTGQKPAIIRPPFGIINDNIIKEARKNNCIIVLWSIDTLDWSQKESANITANVLNNVRPGEIILMHSDEDKQATVQALPGIIAGLQQKGYQVVGLDEMLKINAYKNNKK